MDLRQFLGILRVRWRFIALTLLLGTLVTVGLTLTTPTTYASEATLWVSPPPTGVLDPYNASTTAQQRAESYARLATDPDVLRRVAERLNLGPSSAHLIRGISATVTSGTLLLQVDARAGTPELAQQLATVVSDEIIRLVKDIETPGDSDVPAPIVARLASKASFNPTPVSPNVPLNLVIGIGLSLLAGIAGAVLREVLDSTVKRPDDVEEITGLAPMAALPFDTTVKDYPLISDNAGGPLSEAFRVLRTNVRFANLDARGQTIVVTSSLPDEGKTFVATNLAIAIANGGHSVLLLDGDLRNPNAAKLLGLENSVGLITVMLGRASLEQAAQQHASGLTFLGTGPQPPNPAEVLDTRVMRDLLARLRESFDFVIIDAPPLLPVADTTILLTEVDGAMLLVRHGVTRRAELSRALSRIEAVGGKVLGTVLNQVPLGNRMGDYGYYGYGYGYPTTGGATGDTERVAASKGRRARR
ncbi:MAG: polysaccharide biosynthesis tyrosine autokinase [Aeromicrobium sp.]